MPPDLGESEQKPEMASRQLSLMRLGVIQSVLVIFLEEEVNNWEKLDAKMPENHWNPFSSELLRLLLCL